MDREGKAKGDFWDIGASRVEGGHVQESYQGANPFEDVGSVAGSPSLSLSIYIYIYLPLSLSLSLSCSFSRTDVIC